MGKPFSSLARRRRHHRLRYYSTPYRQSVGCEERSMSVGRKRLHRTTHAPVKTFATFATTAVTIATATHHAPALNGAATTATAAPRCCCCHRVGRQGGGWGIFEFEEIELVLQAGANQLPEL